MATTTTARMVLLLLINKRSKVTIKPQPSQTELTVNYAIPPQPEGLISVHFQESCQRQWRSVSMQRRTAVAELVRQPTGLQFEFERSQSAWNLGFIEWNCCHQLVHLDLRAVLGTSGAHSQSHRAKVLHRSCEIVIAQPITTSHTRFVITVGIPLEPHLESRMSHHT